MNTFPSSLNPRIFLESAQLVANWSELYDGTDGCYRAHCTLRAIKEMGEKKKKPAETYYNMSFYCYLFSPANKSSIGTYWNQGDYNSRVISLLLAYELSIS